MELVVHLGATPDPREADAPADFWTAALGYDRGDYGPPYVPLTGPADERPRILLQRVPEPKAGKNRMHPDLRVTDMEAELAWAPPSSVARSWTAAGRPRCSPTRRATSSA